MNVATIDQLKDRAKPLFAQSLSTYDNAIDHGLRQLASRTGVSASDIDSCQTLRAELLDQIKIKLTQSEQPRMADQSSGWAWQPWKDTHALRIGFLTIRENKPLPIHDHPGSAGLLVVLNGSLQVQQFTASQAHTTARRIELRLEHEQEAGPGEFATFSPLEGNIHSVHAVEGPCIVLDILLNPYKEQERGWYMPMGERRPGQAHINTIRVSRSK